MQRLVEHIVHLSARAKRFMTLQAHSFERYGLNISGCQFRIHREVIFQQVEMSYDFVTLLEKNNYAWRLRKNKLLDCVSTCLSVWISDHKVRNLKQVVLNLFSVEFKSWKKHLSSVWHQACNHFAACIRQSFQLGTLREGIRSLSCSPGRLWHGFLKLFSH